MPAVLGGLAIVFSRIVMALSRLLDAPGVVQWTILIHFVAAGFVFAGLLVHSFMAALAEGESPALRSMFTGTVPEEFVKHRNSLWHEAVVKGESPHQSDSQGSFKISGDSPSWGWALFQGSRRTGAKKSGYQIPASVFIGFPLRLLQNSHFPSPRRKPGSRNR